MPPANHRVDGIKANLRNNFVVNSRCNSNNGDNYKHHPGSFASLQNSFSSRGFGLRSLATFSPPVNFGAAPKAKKNKTVPTSTPRRRRLWRAQGKYDAHHNNSGIPSACPPRFALREAKLFSRQDSCLPLWVTITAERMQPNSGYRVAHSARV